MIKVLRIIVGIAEVQFNKQVIHVPINLAFSPIHDSHTVIPYAIKPERFKRIAAAIRNYLRPSTGTYPVVLVDGDQKPELAGKSYYFTNKSGEIIHHPSAYRRAFGRPIYNPSTRHCIVGQEVTLEWE